MPARWNEQGYWPKHRDSGRQHLYLQAHLKTSLSTLWLLWDMGILWMWQDTTRSNLTLEDQARQCICLCGTWASVMCIPCLTLQRSTQRDSTELYNLSCSLQAHHNTSAAEKPCRIIFGKKKYAKSIGVLWNYPSYHKKVKYKSAAKCHMNWHPVYWK